MKICAYVLETNAKLTYKNECFNTRLNAGMAIVIDILRKKGYEIDYAGKATVHKYDIALMSITSDCDWWPFIAERSQWQKSNCKVIVGGQGVLNVRPFLEFVDYFVLGRAENVIGELVDAISKGKEIELDKFIESSKFDIDKKYTINQVTERYPCKVKLGNGEEYEEDIIGCNHRCLFCGYTWQRKTVLDGEFKYSGLWNGGEDRERAIIDLENGSEINFTKMRTTAIDGLSERLRFMVNKKITRNMLKNFLYRLHTEGKPHQVKLYNIIGYPTETEADWWEFLQDLADVDAKLPIKEKQTSILLHSTPFRAMPATPLACKPMSYKNYRQTLAKTLGRGLKGNILYQGRAMWAVESMATESIPTVVQSAIVWRGTEQDTENILKVALSKKFKSANMQIKKATLENYFDVKKLFGEFNAQTLPTRYLKTYANIEKSW